MITIARVLESFKQAGLRIMKVREFGDKTAHNTAPFGIDSAAPKDMVAVYASTSENGDRVIVGYVNKSILASDGEIRMYSVNDHGEPVAHVWAKSDGTLHLNGDSHTAVRFSPLDASLQGLRSSINVELGKIATAIGGVGGAYAIQDVVIDISSAESETVKLK